MNGREKIRVTYHMYADGEIAETCIDIPVKNDLAKIIATGELCKARNTLSIAIFKIITELAKLQGYQYATIQHMQCVVEPT
jgi:hypothetical protein